MNKQQSAYASNVPGGISNGYQVHGLYSAIQTASPYQLINLLFDGALRQLTSAQFAMQQNKIPEKSQAITKALNIFDGLRSALNMDEGGQIAENLDNLYDYMQRQLIQANLKNEVSLIEEVISLLREVKAGWEAISEENQVA